MDLSEKEYQICHGKSTFLKPEKVAKMQREHTGVGWGFVWFFLGLLSVSAVNINLSTAVEKFYWSNNLFRRIITPWLASIPPMKCARVNCHHTRPSPVKWQLRSSLDPPFSSSFALVLLCRGHGAHFAEWHSSSAWYPEGQCGIVALLCVVASFMRKTCSQQNKISL